MAIINGRRIIVPPAGITGQNLIQQVIPGPGRRPVIQQGVAVLYPSLRVEIPEIKIERVGDLPPRLIRPVGVESLDLEIDGYLGSLVTAKGHGLAKLAPQLPIGSL